MRKRYIVADEKSSFLHAFSSLAMVVVGLALLVLGLLAEGEDAQLCFLWVWLAYCIFAYWLNPKVLYFCCDHINYEVTTDEVLVSVYDGGDFEPVEVYSSNSPRVAEILILEEQKKTYTATLVVRNYRGEVIRQFEHLILHKP